MKAVFLPSRRPVARRAKASSRIPALCALAAFLAFAASSTGWAEDLQEPESPEPEVPYTVSLEGVPENALRGRLLSASRLESLRARPPASVLALRRRADEDMERLNAVLRAEGFYDPALSYRLERPEEGPVTVSVQVETGPLYLLEDYVLRYADAEPEAEGLPAVLEDLGLTAGQAARSETVVAAQSRLLRILREQGRPFAEVDQRRAVVDHDRRTMTVTLDISAGPRAVFGLVRFEGLETVEADYLRRLLPWREGELYDRRKVDAARERLIATALFETVEIVHGDPGQMDAQGRLPMTVRVSEGRHRSVGAGLGYSSDEGVGGRVFWEHRNLFGQGERVTPSLRLSEKQSRLAVDARKPAYLRADQDLFGDAALTDRRTEAYDETGATAKLGLERKLDRHWRVSAATSLEYASLKERDRDTRLQLFGLPLNAVRDDTDSLLDPREGTRLTMGVTPYVGKFTSTASFVLMEAGGSAYVSFGPEERMTLAGRARAASLMGENTKTIHVNRRLFSGGGGLRGYGFQMAGPLDERNKPVGGRSLVEAGVELRARVTETIGLVPFVEAGGVHDAALPSPARRLFWAAGLGLRYYTPVGPLRLDVGVPLNRRAGVDDPFQVFISLGQAF